MAPDVREVFLSDGAVQIRFSEISDPYSDGYEFRSFTAEIEDDGLTAKTTVVSVEMEAGLATFVQSLADDWRGWDGIRKWKAIENQLHISAEHEATGKVKLLVELRQSPYLDAWSASVSITISAGEELRNFAQAVTEFCA